ncbi:hypothetical protein DFH27DRAFT_652090 [Peziza echinospora]|nr:hypothetical protein DFH27DRAFT_652090 [Peziza echinospora]
MRGNADTRTTLRGPEKALTSTSTATKSTARISAPQQSYLRNPANPATSAIATTESPSQPPATSGDLRVGAQKLRYLVSASGSGNDNDNDDLDDYQRAQYAHILQHDHEVRARARAQSYTAPEVVRLTTTPSRASWEGHGGFPLDGDEWEGRRGRGYYRINGESRGTPPNPIFCPFFTHLFNFITSHLGSFLLLLCRFIMYFVIGLMIVVYNLCMIVAMAGLYCLGVLEEKVERVMREYGYGGWVGWWRGWWEGGFVGGDGARGDGRGGEWVRELGGVRFVPVRE